MNFWYFGMKFACKGVAVLIFERQRKDLDDDKCELRKRKHLHNSDKLGFWQRKCESKRHPSDKQHLLDP